MHARTTTPASPPNASPNKATDDDPRLIDSLNVRVVYWKSKNDWFWRCQTPRYSFQSSEARDAYVGAAHQQFPDLVFFAHDPKAAPEDLSAKAINVPLSLNSYKPKRWLTSHSIPRKHGCRYGTNYWFPRLYIYNGTSQTILTNFATDVPKERSRSGSRSRSRSKGPGNSQSSQPRNPQLTLDLLIILTGIVLNPMINVTVWFPFLRSCRTPPPPSAPNQAITMSPQEAANILSFAEVSPTRHG
ncbi:hypothetical protein RclHR1_29280002 [Rhizophagus clarus]|uniref:Uncharacterized protein n=1 Tax=Rhizophagus clarus TaxID=94130 RepID=A0A2Z6R490_9GLOM|nr:hypothetical protein RclHR1_29280002 [Rhizophagus clarus]